MAEVAPEISDQPLPAFTCHCTAGVGTPLAAAFHVARTVCRRAERRVVTLASLSDTTIPANAIEYLNRLGDLLFVLGRVANRQAGVADDPWIHP